jgi:hypothetical protein
VYTNNNLNWRRPTPAPGMEHSVAVRGGQVLLVGVYCPPESRSEVDEVVRLRNDNLTLVVAGDFNAKHTDWDPGCAPDARGRRIAAWAAGNGLQPAIVGQATHSQGGCLDNFFAPPGVGVGTVLSCEVKSDHFPVEFSPLRPMAGKSQLPRRATIPPRRRQDYLWIARKGLEQMPDVAEDASVEDIEKAAENIFRCLKLSGQAVSQAHRNGKAWPWWDEDCRSAKAAAATGGREDRRQYRALITAKRVEHWRGVIAKATLGNGRLWDVCKWRKAADDPVPPAMGDALTIPQVAECLYRAHMEGVGVSDCPGSDPIPWVPPKARPLERRLTDEEAYWYACDKPSTTAPGLDMATTEDLRALWAGPGGKGKGPLGRLLPPLYRACLRRAHYPQAWKTVEVVEVPKPGKKKRDTPKAYRPIALVTTVAKGLERVVAARVEEDARKSGVFPRQLAGPVRGRSATDLVAALLHDVDVAVVAQRKVVVVKADVAQAFPSIRPGRMVRRVVEVGLGASLATFVDKFMTNRYAVMRLDGKRRPQAGLPQGSPLSPVLLALYMSTAPQAAGVFNYVDDFGAVASGRDHAQAKRALQAWWQRLEEWARREGVVFDPGKTEYLEVGNKNGAIVLGGRRVESTGTVTFLGVVVDYKMSFREHVEKVTTKANRMAGLLRRVCQVSRGLPPKAAQVATRAVVESQVHYAIEAWFPGPVRRRLGKVAGKAAVAQTRKLDGPVNTALRAALPAWRTTPTTAVRFHAGRPPTLVVAAERKRALVRRVELQGEQHPLYERLRSGKDTRLTRAPEAPTAQQWYAQHSSLSCNQQLQRFRDSPPELHLPRRVLHKLIADRTGHGRFRSYFVRFKPECPELADGAKCPCGRPLEPNHPERCEALRGLRRPDLWGVGRAWTQQIEDYYHHQEVLLDFYEREHAE